MTNKNLTFETYYEFALNTEPLQTNYLCRLWLKANHAEQPDWLRLHDLVDLIRMNHRLLADLPALAAYIATIPGVAAVHVQDVQLGVGNVIYVDWP